MICIGFLCRFVANKNFVNENIEHSLCPFCFSYSELWRGEKTEMEDGKEIIVKLIHNPSDTEKPYRIELGEFSEKYYQGNVVRWIK